MTSSGPVLRTCAFGDSAPGAWGCAWVLDAPGDPFVVLGWGPDAVRVAATLDGGGPAAPWTLHGELVELEFCGVSEAVVSNGSDPAMQDFDQLCHVSGSVVLGGSEHQVDCLGYRAARAVDKPLDRYDSIRQLAAWFAPGEAVALRAVRPRRAKGHGDDVISVALMEEAGPATVDDPRFSTTYTEDGRPSRAGLELWIGEEDGEQRMRRAAGEAVGPHADGALGELHAWADLFRWHSRGRDGIGVYLLARRT